MYLLRAKREAGILASPEMEVGHILTSPAVEGHLPDLLPCRRWFSGFEDIEKIASKTKNTRFLCVDSQSAFKTYESPEFYVF
jgi:hypothetical protein